MTPHAADLILMFGLGSLVAQNLGRYGRSRTAGKPDRFALGFALVFLGLSAILVARSLS